MEQNLAPLAHPIDAAARRIGIGRTMVYALIKSGELRVVKIGGRTLILESELHRFLAERAQQVAA